MSIPRSISLKKQLIKIPMLILCQASSQQLLALLERSASAEIDGLRLPMGEEIAPRFWIEFVNDKLSQETENSFWWSPRFVVVHGSIVGMCGFKSPPDIDGTVEIGYGIVDSQQKRGFATQAVDLLVEEGFLKTEIRSIVAHTEPSNSASCKVLAKNQFVRSGSKIDPDDGEVWSWQRMR